MARGSTLGSGWFRSRTVAKRIGTTPELPKVEQTPGVVVGWLGIRWGVGSVNG